MNSKVGTLWKKCFQELRKHTLIFCVVVIGLIQIGKWNKKWWDSFLHISVGLNSLPGSWVETTVKWHHQFNLCMLFEISRDFLPQSKNSFFLVPLQICCQQKTIDYTHWVELMVSGSLKFFCNLTKIPSGWHKFHEKLQINMFTRPKEKKSSN